MHRIATTFAALAMSMLAGASALGAQDRGRQDAVPKGFEPPRGMCRVWINGVPAGQQPAPTDCATAIRRRPDNGRVVFGESARDGRDPRRDAIRDALRGEASRGEAGRGEVPDPPRRDLRGRREEPRAPDPKPADPPAERQGRRRAEPPPPDLDYDEQLAIEASLDLELLAALYGGPSAGRAGGASRVVTTPAGERGTVRAPAVSRGRGGATRVGPAERELEWATTADGAPLSAWEVERLLLEQRYDDRYERMLAQQLRSGAAAERLAGPEGEGPYAGGRVPARPGECLDRDFDGRCDDLSGGADGCFDANRDGRCDDARWDPYAGGRAPSGRGDAGYGLCFDRDRDGRCDEPWSADRRIPQTLPEMGAAVGLRRGVASYDVERWLRRTDLQPRLADRDGDGLPERVTWLDPAGRVVQLWTDRDGDGIADRVELFRDGVPVQVIGR